MRCQYSNRHRCREDATHAWNEEPWFAFCDEHWPAAVEILDPARCRRLRKDKRDSRSSLRHEGMRLLAEGASTNFLILAFGVTERTVQRWRYDLDAQAVTA